MRKHLPLMILVIVVVMVLGGYLGYTSLTQDKIPPVIRESNPPPAPNDGADDLSINSKNVEKDIKVSPQTIEKTNVPNADTKAGELIVWGEVKAVDVDKWILTIDQQMDDNSVKISPNVPVNKNAVIRTKQEVISLAQINPGDSVGIIVTKDGQARAVLVNY